MDSKPNPFAMYSQLQLLRFKESELFLISEVCHPRVGFTTYENHRVVSSSLKSVEPSPTTDATSQPLYDPTVSAAAVRRRYIFQQGMRVFYFLLVPWAIFQSAPVASFIAIIVYLCGRSRHHRSMPL